MSSRTRARAVRPVAGHITATIRLARRFTPARRWGSDLMEISSRRTVPTRLREAVDAYRAEQKDNLDHHALNLLARLAESSDAGKAFERLKVEDRCNVAAFLTTCIRAHDLARTFPQRIMKAKKTSARMLRLFTPAVELLVFVAELIDEQENPPAFDPLSRELSASPADISAMWHGLNLIAAYISGKATSAREEVLWLGATRKNQIKQAGENAAIGWLAEGVRHITGRARLSAVRDLAEVILDVEIDDLERVRRCARVRKREWRKSSRMIQLAVRPSPEPNLLRDAIASAKRRVRLTKNA